MSQEELKGLFDRLGCAPNEVLRRRDATMAGLTGEETTETLIAAMAENPKLLQRPIGVVGERAVVGRPVEALLELVTR